MAMELSASSAVATELSAADPVRITLPVVQPKGLGGLELPPGLDLETCGPPPGLELPDGLEPPPGLEMPPGLDVECPPGFECTPSSSMSTAASTPPCLANDFLLQTFKVCIRGLPKAIANDVCMEAVMEQAGIEAAVVNCRVKRGKINEAVVELSCPLMALHCVNHFNGCMWDSSGTPVTATIMPPKESVKKVAEVTTEQCSASPSLQLSAEAAVFVPSNSTLSSMCASAPAFVPCVTRKETKSSARSDASTDFGESGSEDERSVSRKVTSALK